MTHYVCTGSCSGESQNPGVCEAEFCSKEGKSLTFCNCEDGAHEEAGKKPDESEDSDV